MADAHKQMLSALGLEDQILRGGVGAVPDMWKQISHVEDAKEYQIAQIVQGQVQQQLDAEKFRALGGQAQNFPPNVSPVGQFPTGSAPNQQVALASRAREMFLKRMGGIRNELRIAPDDFLQCHIYGEVVHLFYCFGGRAGVTQESIDLFPSDQLITQFRMVLST
jgi:hypothetical protein